MALSVKSSAAYESSPMQWSPTDTTTSHLLLSLVAPKTEGQQFIPFENISPVIDLPKDDWSTGLPSVADVSVLSGYQLQQGYGNEFNDIVDVNTSVVIPNEYYQQNSLSSLNQRLVQPQVVVRNFLRGDEEPPVVLDSNCFERNQVTVYDVLGQGSNGASYVACFYNSCNAVMKIGNISQRELYIAHKMGDGGVGPKILHAFQCNAYNDTVPANIVVMERLPMTLEDYIAEGNVLTRDHAQQLSRLLHHAQAHGIVHMDVKLDNIMLKSKSSYDTLGNIVSEIERFYLIDFGMSYISHAPDGTLIPYLPQEYNGWVRAVPANISDSIGSAWDLLCLLASLQLEDVSQQQVGDCVSELIQILASQYRINSRALQNTLSFLTEYLPSIGQAILT